MLFCYIIINNVTGKPVIGNMLVWDGIKNDTTNFTSDTFLQVNSCGYQNALSEYTVVRKCGRVDYHILLIDNGTCEVFHNGSTHTLTPGDLIFYAPYEEQKYSFKSDSASLWCHFTGTAVKEILNSCNMTSGVYRMKPSQCISESFFKLVRRFNQPNRKKIASASLLELIYNIGDIQSCDEKNDKKYALLTHTITYINMNYNKTITLEQLAKQSGYSKTGFSHLFSEIMGTSPMKYINGIRLNTACEMLSSTNLSISNIALNCGFKDPLYFSKLFLKKYNVTPSQYRLSK